MQSTPSSLRALLANRYSLKFLLLLVLLLGVALGAGVWRFHKNNRQVVATGKLTRSGARVLLHNGVNNRHSPTLLQLATEELRIDIEFDCAKSALIRHEEKRVVAPLSDAPAVSRVLFKNGVCELILGTVVAKRPRVSHIEFSQCLVSSDVIRGLSDQDGNRTIEFRYCTFDGPEVVEELACVKGINDLYIYPATDLDTNGVRCLISNRSLCALEIPRCSSVTIDDALAGDLARLAALDITWATAHPGAIETIARGGKIEILRISSNQCDASAFSALAKCVSLRELHVETIRGERSRIIRQIPEMGPAKVYVDGQEL
jgi:hypothetical protein